MKIKNLEQGKKLILERMKARKDIHMIYPTYRYDYLLFRNSQDMVGNIKLKGYWQDTYLRFTDDYLRYPHEWERTRLMHARLRDYPPQNIKSLGLDDECNVIKERYKCNTFEYTCHFKEVTEVFDYIMDNYFKVTSAPPEHLFFDLKSEKPILGQSFCGYFWTKETDK